VLNYFIGWLKGYIVITILGKNKERFLNLALQQNIDIYDVEQPEEQSNIIIAKACYRDLRRLRKIARQTHCHFKMGRRRGLPFAYGYMKKRKMLAIGLVIFCIGLYVLSGFVWFVEVTPREKIKYLDENEVISLAEEYGIKRGVWGRDLDFDAVEKELLKEIDELSWISIERKGILINFNVAERGIWTEEENNATMGAIWANRTALLEEVLIKHGQPMVEAGQLVHKGDLLVSPLADGKADAIIRGRVWYEGYGECAMSSEIQKTVEKPKKNIYIMGRDSEKLLKIWGMEESSSDGNQKVEKTIIKPRLWQDITLPINFLVETVTPMETVTITMTEGEAKAKALAEARQSLRQQIGENNVLLEETIEYHLKNGVCTMSVKWECKEEIGMRNFEQKNQNSKGNS
jgi:similar to stage IV sporulation protein